jgi:hypothetical protein
MIGLLSMLTPHPSQPYNRELVLARANGDSLVLEIMSFEERRVQLGHSW